MYFVYLKYFFFQEFLQRVGLEAELSGFCQKFGFDLLLLMTISFTESKEPIRELAVFSLSSVCSEQVHTDTAFSTQQYYKYSGSLFKTLEQSDQTSHPS